MIIRRVGKNSDEGSDLKRGLRIGYREMKQRWSKDKEEGQLEAWVDEGSIRIIFGKMVWGWIAVALTNKMIYLDQKILRAGQSWSVSALENMSQEDKEIGQKEYQLQENMIREAQSFQMFSRIISLSVAKSSIFFISFLNSPFTPCFNQPVTQDTAQVSQGQTQSLSC